MTFDLSGKMAVVTGGNGGAIPVVGDFSARE